jgi:DNA-directed RNA polymerase specialized sigma24 family protein
MVHRRTDDAQATTAEGFARLLRRLADDPDKAAIEYERLRLTLVKFFDWRGAWPPDECADETLDRLAGKLEFGTPIDDVVRYAHGIARLVLLERLRRQAQDPQRPIDDRVDVAAQRSLSPEDARGPLHQCFERCLEGLPAESRRLVLEYYVGEGQTKIDRRRQLARSLGLSDNALPADKVGLDAALRHISSDQDT